MKAWNCYPNATGILAIFSSNSSSGFLLKSHCFRFCALAFKWNAGCPLEGTSGGTYHVHSSFQSGGSALRAERGASPCCRSLGWGRGEELYEERLWNRTSRGAQCGKCANQIPFKGTVSISANGFLRLSFEVTDCVCKNPIWTLGSGGSSWVMRIFPPPPPLADSLWTISRIHHQLASVHTLCATFDICSLTQNSYD